MKVTASLAPSGLTSCKTSAETTNQLFIKCSIIQYYTHNRKAVISSNQWINNAWFSAIIYYVFKIIYGLISIFQWRSMTSALFHCSGFEILLYSLANMFSRFQSIPIIILIAHCIIDHCVTVGQLELHEASLSPLTSWEGLFFLV